MKTTGDGVLVEFGSVVVDVLRYAVEVQQAMPERDTGIGAESRIELRIGINLGDVIVEGDDLYGDGVNIAARLEDLADPGGVFVSNPNRRRESRKTAIFWGLIGASYSRGYSRFLVASRPCATQESVSGTGWAAYVPSHFG